MQFVQILVSFTALSIYQKMFTQEYNIAHQDKLIFYHFITFCGLADTCTGEKINSEWIYCK